MSSPAYSDRVPLHRRGDEPGGSDVTWMIVSVLLGIAVAGLLIVAIGM